MFISRIDLIIVLSPSFSNSVSVIRSVYLVGAAGVNVQSSQDCVDRQHLLQVMVSKDNPRIGHVEVDNSIAVVGVGVDSHLAGAEAEFDYCRNPVRSLLDAKAYDEACRAPVAPADR